MSIVCSRGSPPLSRAANKELLGTKILRPKFSPDFALPGIPGNRPRIPMSSGDGKTQTVLKIRRPKMARAKANIFLDWLIFSKFARQRSAENEAVD